MAAAEVFEGAAYAALTPGWPDHPETVEQANAHPEVFADKTVAQVADHFAEVIRKLDTKPAVIGTPSAVCSPRSSRSAIQPTDTALCHSLTIGSATALPTR